ncbi:MAG: TetR/AcrR family transcriptional regulator [Chlorobi bacterium]|nr:TetR/AcrR family transcriptional regulator [Chlorobiota bacterium]
MEDIYKKIIDRVCALFNKYGIRSITMDEIASELGISKKTLYGYFTDKKELVSKVLETEIEKKAVLFQKIRDQNLNAVEEILEVNKLVLQLVREYNPGKQHDLKKYYPDLYEKIVSVQRTRMYHSMKTNLKKGKKEGLYREDLDEDIISKLYISRMEVPMTNDFLTPEEFTSDRFIMQAFNYHIHGIASEKGLEVAKKLSLKTNKSKQP